MEDHFHHAILLINMEDITKVDHHHHLSLFLTILGH
jgi:hypothetical protein